MKEGSSVDNESDSDGNFIVTSTQYGDDAPLVNGTIATAPAQGDQSSGGHDATGTIQDESQNVGRIAYQGSMDIDRGTQLDNPLISRASRPQEGKHSIRPSQTIRPGAVAMSGLNEGNNYRSSNQENTILDRRESKDAVIKGTATMAMGLDQENTVLQATSHGVISMGDDDMTDRQLDCGMAQVNLAEIPVELDTCSAMVEAELVMPPIEAVRVSIDEDPSIAMNHVHPFELEHAPTRDHSDGTRSKKFGPIFWVLLALLVVTVLCATLIPYTIRTNDESSDGSVSQDPSNPHNCYTTLLDILNAQIHDDTLDAPTYVICPNTKIKIGTMNNPSLDDYRYVNGDYPIMVTRENVTIQCGWDGRRDNNCVVDAGFTHVLTLQVVPMPDGSMYDITRTNDNLVIRGITFTGMLINVGPFSSRSISLSHPGRNMRFEDCLWHNMTAQSGLIGVSRNYYQELVGLALEDLSIEVSFVDCIFENIIYDAPLVFVRYQTTKLERCIFQDIQVSLLAQDYCRYKSGDTGEVVETESGCASLLHCTSQSYCSMKDVCVHGVETWSEGVVVINNDTIFNHQGLYLEPTTSTTLNGTCEMATYSALEWTNFSCSNIFDEPSCPLLP